MFSKETYIKRREELKKNISSGVVLLAGNSVCSLNYKSNLYKFRQDSSFLYYFGLDKEDLFGVIDIDNDIDYIYGDDFTIDDIIWMGEQPAIKDLAASVGINKIGSKEDLCKELSCFIDQGRKIHYLPPYRGDQVLLLERLLGINSNNIEKYASLELINAVIKQRSKKSGEEVKEIEKALDISRELYITILENIKPGMKECQIVGLMQGIWASYDSYYSFPPIVTINGQTLHNEHYGNTLKEGDLLLVDSGVESPLHYASDITRTFPVSKKFTSKQKDIYQIVLNAQLKSIDMLKPGLYNKEAHLKASEIIAGGLKDLGLMKGDVKEAVSVGAHALFFPHGLGHMMGLDVHDMEGLGEDRVGYGNDLKRSTQFGLSALRLGRKLEEGFVLTVEPGMYFIPALIEKWKTEKKFEDFINYDKVCEYLDFGGIRIEDDVLITKDSHRVLGNNPIPKEVADIESF